MNRAIQFETPQAIWWIAILGGMGLTALLAFERSAFQWWSEWITTALSQSVFQWIFGLAILAHVGEALYALKLASTDKWRWTLQTFLLGYPSLSLLVKKQ